MIAGGASDQAVADKIGVHRTAVARHRHNHIIAPAKAVAEMAGKGADATAQRGQVMAAAEAGDPMAFIGAAAIVGDMRKTWDRVERSSEVAETAGHGTSVAALAGQQIRMAEVRAKMGGVGGYAPGGVGQGAPSVPFSVTINLGTDYPLVSVRTAPTIEGNEVEADQMLTD